MVVQIVQKVSSQSILGFFKIPTLHFFSYSFQLPDIRDGILDGTPDAEVSALPHVTRMEYCEDFGNSLNLQNLPFSSCQYGSLRRYLVRSANARGSGLFEDPHADHGMVIQSEA